MKPSRGEAWFTQISVLLVGGSGLIYAWMCYLAEPEDPYAVVNHPWQPDLQHLHVLVAPLLVFGLGWLWSGHLRAGLRRGVRRPSRMGVSAVLFALPMVLSGYLLQITVEEAWRKTWVVVHVVTSLLWLAAYLAHLPWGRWLRRGGEREEPRVVPCAKPEAEVRE